MRNNKKKLTVISNKMVTNEIKLSNIIPQVSRKRKKFFAFLTISITLLVLIVIVIFLLVWL